MDIGKANDLESVCTINLHNLSLIVHEMYSYAVKKRNERKKITLQVNPGVFFYNLVGKTGFEPVVSYSRSMRDNQASLLPDAISIIDLFEKNENRK